MSPSDPDSCICLDAEFAEGREMLELSICNFDGEEIYHRRFRPATLRRWSHDIHHITPAMVAREPRFADCVPEVQAIIDRADCVAGFALRNDVRVMRREGVVINRQRLLEVQDWFWLCVGRERGLDLREGRNLRACCDELGVALSDAEAHSAGADTRATLECLRRLIDRFAADNRDVRSWPALMARYDELFGVAKQEYDRLNAAGYAALLAVRPGFYRVKTYKNRPEPSDNLVAVVEVADRERAKWDLRQRLARKGSPSEPYTYRLTEADIERFGHYANDYTPDDEGNIFRSLNRLSESWGR